MKKADMGTFTNYLEYKLGITPEHIMITGKSEFETLKGYFFQAIEGYELDGNYEDFKQYIEKKYR